MWEKETIKWTKRPMWENNRNMNNARDRIARVKGKRGNGQNSKCGKEIGTWTRQPMWERSRNMDNVEDRWEERQNS